MAADANLGAQLVEISGPHAGRVHELPYGEHVAGRGGGAQLLLEDGDVSRRHALLKVAPRGLSVEDLGSKNGVLMGGRRVEPSEILVHGQVITIGNLRLRIVHPATQVSAALASAGEATVTTTHTTSGDDVVRRRSLLVPAAGVLLFGLLVAAMLLR